MSQTARTENRNEPPAPRKARRSRSPKAERTRASLKTAALKLMYRTGFHDMKITDICEEAGIASGTFYIHFKDKTELALEVVKETLAENEDYIFSGPHIEDPYDAIYDANRRYVETFIEAGPLNRVLAQLIDADADMRAYWDAYSNRVANRIASAIVKRSAKRGADKADAFLLSHAAQGMSDYIAMQMFAWQNEDLIRAGGNADALTEKLSVMYHRILYGCDPSLSKLKHAKGLLKLTLK
jgi:AcrR family transcriptional regulator